MVLSVRASSTASAAILAPWLLLAACAPPTPPTSSAPGHGRVVDVVDGDTVRLTIGGHEETVRLLGIDTPETVHPQRPEQCFGAQASAALAELLPVGTDVRLERDQDGRDHYGRLLLYLYRAADGLFINRWLVQNGFADTSFYAPNTALKVPFEDERRRARADNVGLWGACDGPDQPIDGPRPDTWAG